MDIKAMVEKDDTVSGRAFDWFVQGMILLSVVTFSMETLPDLQAGTRRVLNIVETVILTVFTMEYFLRILVANPKRDYILSFFGIVDLLAILPFYIIFGVDLQVLRIFRMLRLFRILKMLRYNAAIRRFFLALTLAREEMVLFGVVTMMLLYLAAVGIYYFENEAQPEAFKSIFHSLWWAVSTLTTVGYGDIYPVTVGGKLFTFMILMLGLGIVAVPAGLLAAALAQTRADDSDDEQK